ncbi:MAG TPA: hypothetical protein VFQ65_29145 [Kofleriaceae bacterium]|nr:hypothetical protein [Kofleriaceae bacterium]
MLKLAALLIALTTACTTDPTPVVHIVQSGPGTADNRVTVVAREAVDDMSEVDDPNVCDVLPPDGACAHACDPEGLAQFIPPGTCVLMVCQLTDGRTIKVGGCN